MKVIKSLFIVASAMCLLASCGKKADAPQQEDAAMLENESGQEEVKDASEASLFEGVQLTKVDGSKVDISTLWSEGKYTYVDCWATWCGPCCREIPYLEKLAEKMKDQNKVQFVSLSLDRDVEAWKQKIANDKPQWTQYILDEEASEILCQALDITGIPHFFIIGPDGNLVNPDANRPSSEGIEAELRGLQVVR